MGGEGDGEFGAGRGEDSEEGGAEVGGGGALVCPRAGFGEGR